MARGRERPLPYSSAMSSDRDATAPSISSTPLTAETPLSELRTTLTPIRAFYVRSHFEVPRLEAATWRLRVGGRVEQPQELSLKDLYDLPGRDVCVTLECAGNGRRAMDPPPPGILWGFGAVGTARFTGVPLVQVLDRVGVGGDATEVVFVGADTGRANSGEIVSFARSLPVEVARHPDTLVAWAMNGRALRAEHGFPARLVVPRWYAMASVKWLVGVEVLDAPFAGHFQKDDYMYVDGEGQQPSRPVTLIRVRAVIGSPADGAEVRAGPVAIAGTAWSGDAPVVRVEVSVDGGAIWSEAELGPAPSPYAAHPWRYRVPLAAGSYSIVARATDGAGHTQPTDPLRNVRGYGNNVPHRVRLFVTSGQASDHSDLKVLRRGSPHVPA